MLSAASPSAPAMFARAPLWVLATNAAMQPLLVGLGSRGPTLATAADAHLEDLAACVPRTLTS